MNPRKAEKAAQEWPLGDPDQPAQAQAEAATQEPAPAKFDSDPDQPAKAQQG